MCERKGEGTSGDTRRLMVPGPLDVELIGPGMQFQHVAHRQPPSRVPSGSGKDRPHCRYPSRQKTSARYPRAAGQGLAYGLQNTGRRAVLERISGRAPTHRRHRSASLERRTLGAVDPRLVAGVTGVAVGAVVIAGAWIVYRPIVAVILLALVAALVGFLVWRARQAKARVAVAAS